MSELYEVGVERTIRATLYVLANGEDDAINQAKWLLDDEMFDGGGHEDDWFTFESDGAPDGHRVWSGGPEGRWIEPGEVGP